MALSIELFMHTSAFPIISTSTALYAFLHHTHCNANKQIIPKIDTKRITFEADSLFFMKQLLKVELKIDSKVRYCYKNTNNTKPLIHP